METDALKKPGDIEEERTAEVVIRYTEGNRLSVLSNIHDPDAVRYLLSIALEEMLADEKEVLQKNNNLHQTVLCVTI